MLTAGGGSDMSMYIFSGRSLSISLASQSERQKAYDDGWKSDYEEKP